MLWWWRWGWCCAAAVVWVGWWRVMACSNRLVGCGGFEWVVQYDFWVWPILHVFFTFQLFFFFPLSLFYFWSFKSSLESFQCLVSPTKHLQLTTHSHNLQAPSLSSSSSSSPLIRSTKPISSLTTAISLSISLHPYQTIQMRRARECGCRFWQKWWHGWRYR